MEQETWQNDGSRSAVTSDASLCQKVFRALPWKPLISERLVAIQLQMRQILAGVRGCGWVPSSAAQHAKVVYSRNLGDRAQHAKVVYSRNLGDRAQHAKVVYSRNLGDRAQHAKVVYSRNLGDRAQHAKVVYSRNLGDRAQHAKVVYSRNLGDRGPSQPLAFMPQVYLLGERGPIRTIHCCWRKSCTTLYIYESPKVLGPKNPKA